MGPLMFNMFSPSFTMFPNRISPTELGLVNHSMLWIDFAQTKDDKGWQGMPTIKVVNPKAAAPCTRRQLRHGLNDLSFGIAICSLRRKNDNQLDLLIYYNLYIHHEEMGNSE